MNWCQPHWDKLRVAIEVRGLSKFIAKDGVQAANNLADDFNNDDPTFDPLMGSWLRINNQMLESPLLNGRILECPFCILINDGRPELVDDWIDGVTDAAVMYAIEEGLIKGQ